MKSLNRIPPRIDVKMRSLERIFAFGEKGEKIVANHLKSAK